MMIDRHQQPSLHEIDLLRMIPPREVMLSNGSTMYVMPVDNTEIIKLEFLFSSGSYLQEQKLQSYFSFNQMHEGTRSYGVDELETKMEDCGASISLNNGLFYSTITVTCLQKCLTELLPYIYSILTEPIYDPSRLIISINQAKKAFEINRMNVGVQCERMLYESLYGKNHVLCRFADLKDYDNINRECLISFHSEYINSKNCSIWLTGAINDSLLKEVERFFGNNSWGKSERQNPRITIESDYNQPIQEKRAEENMQGVQTCVMMGRKFPSISHSDYHGLVLLSTIFGGYYSSRLMTNLRHIKGITYNVSSKINITPVANMLVITTQTDNANANKAIEGIYEEMRRLKSELITDDELKLVVNYMTGRLCRSMEQGLNQSQIFMKKKIYNKTLDSEIEEIKRIRLIKPTELIDIANKYLDEDKFVECLAGNLNQTK